MDSPLTTFWKSSNHTYKIEDWKSDVKELLWLWVTARCLGSTRSSFWAMTYPSTEVRWVKIPWQWPCHHHRFGCHGLPYISSSSLSFFSLRPKAGGSPNIILEFKPLLIVLCRGLEGESIMPPLCAGLMKLACIPLEIGNFEAMMNLLPPYMQGPCSSFVEMSIGNSMAPTFCYWLP